MILFLLRTKGTAATFFVHFRRWRGIILWGWDTACIL